MQITEYNLSIAASEVSSFRKSNKRLTTVRAYADGCVGVAGAIGKVDIAALKREAEANLQNKIAYPCLLTEGQVRACPLPADAVAPAQFLPTMKGLLARLKARFTGYLFGNKIFLKKLSASYQNSLGTQYEDHTSALGLALLIKDKKSANIMDLFYGKQLDRYDEDGAIEEIAELISAYENPLPMPKKPLPVLFERGLISPILSHLTGELYTSGASLVAGKLGERVFSPKVSVVIDRHKPFSALFFDAEGTTHPNDMFYLVKEGVLQGLLTTKRSAQMFGLPCSGNADAAYDGVPNVSAEGVRFVATAQGYRAAGECIVIHDASGGDMTATGDLGIPVQSAFLMRDGKLIGRLPEFMLGGNLFDVLGDNLIDVIDLPDHEQRILATMTITA